MAWIGRYFVDSADRRTLFVGGMHWIELHERALLAALLDGLRAIDGVDVYWDRDDLTQRDLIVGIGFANLEPTQAAREYERHGVIV